MRSKDLCVRLTGLLFLALTPVSAFAATNFVQTNLVSDQDNVAANKDPNLVGTWGISTSATSPFWVSNTSNGTSTLYNTAGVPNATVVVVPAAPSTKSKVGTPTGQVQNPLGVFAVAAGKIPSFIFATLDGTIAGWNSTMGDGKTATTMVDNSARGASYFGLGIGTSSAGPTLYAANFAQGRIDTFDQNWAPLNLPGGFRDRDLPAGYSPSNIQRFGHRLYVTYNLPDGHGSFVYGPGRGFVNVYDLDGNLLQRLIPQSPNVNVPWGVAVAGPNFGVFSYALIVGNFGDGTISAFDPITGDYLGTMQDGKGNNVAIDGLWGLIFGNGGNGGDPTTLYFAAAPVGGQHGLFGSLKPAADSNVP